MRVNRQGFKTFLIVASVAALCALAGAARAEKIALKQAKGAGGPKTMLAGFAETDDAYIWGLKWDETAKWERVTLYVNADNKSTGREQVVGGSDYYLLKMTEENFIRMQLYKDTAKDEKPKPYDGRRLASTLARVIEQDGSVCYVISKKMFSRRPVEPTHQFRFLVALPEPKKGEGRNFTVSPSDEDMGLSVDFAGFKK